MGNRTDTSTIDESNHSIGQFAGPALRALHDILAAPDLEDMENHLTEVLRQTASFVRFVPQLLVVDENNTVLHLPLVSPSGVPFDIRKNFRGFLKYKLASLGYRFKANDKADAFYCDILKKAKNEHSLALYCKYLTNSSLDSSIIGQNAIAGKYDVYRLNLDAEEWRDFLGGRCYEQSQDIVIGRDAYARMLREIGFRDSDFHDVALLACGWPSHGDIPSITVILAFLPKAFEAQEGRVADTNPDQAKLLEPFFRAKEAVSALNWGIQVSVLLMQIYLFAQTSTSAPSLIVEDARSKLWPILLGGEITKGISNREPVRLSETFIFFITSETEYRRRRVLRELLDGQLEENRHAFAVYVATALGEFLGALERRDNERLSGVFSTAEIFLSQDKAEGISPSRFFIERFFPSVLGLLGCLSGYLKPPSSPEHLDSIVSKIVSIVQQFIQGQLSQCTEGTFTGTVCKIAEELFTNVSERSQDGLLNSIISLKSSSSNPLVLDRCISSLLCLGKRLDIAGQQKAFFEAGNLMTANLPAGAHWFELTDMVLHSLSSEQLNAFSNVIGNRNVIARRRISALSRELDIQALWDKPRNPSKGLRKNNFSICRG